MKRSNLVGNHILLEDQGDKTFTNAIVDAIDSASNSIDVYPWCKSATVQEYRDSHNFHSLGYATTLAQGQKVAFGVFLTADNDKGNLVFDVNGCINIQRDGTNVSVYPIFGRTYASTLTQSDAAASNLLDHYIILPFGLNPVYEVTNFQDYCTFKNSILSIELSDGYIYCLAWVIESHNSGADVGMIFHASLDIQKYSSVTNVYRPDRN